jgi:orotidine-5'-phosphate decarboxylase
LFPREALSGGIRILIVMSDAGHFADRLAEAVERKGAPLCVGLDPDPALMPEGVGVVEFCCGIVDAVAGIAVAVKPQAAFFEAQGADGWAALIEVCGYAREAGVLVIADAKRGDVPTTARAYASAFAPLADAVTVNPYLGLDSLEPFFARDGLGVFVLVKTSNPGSVDVQDLPLADGRPVWQHVAGLVDRWGSGLVGESGLSSVGAVVGATFPQEVAEARQLLPRSVLLLPGIGAQGARPEDLAQAFSVGPAGALVSASRSVLYADRGAGWQEAAAAEAERLAGELRAVAAVG